MTAGDRVDAVVVGAGFAGLYQLHLLREAGLSVRVFERGDGVGGTWYWNRYPGARCDVESLDYSYSFSPELEQEWTWTERYPAQPEILAYLNHVADRFDLRRDITFETAVVAAHLDESTGRWAVTTDGGQTLDTQFLVMASGCLSVSKAPEVPGIASFDGRVLHTGRWPHEGVDVSGKRLAVIGTGSSGVQSIPVLARDAAELTVFQRTANYSVPSHNHRLSDEEIAERKRHYREHRAEARRSRLGIPYPMPTRGVFDVDDAERDRIFRDAWASGKLFSLPASFTDIRSSLEANEQAAGFVRDRIREKVDDPATAEKLAPHAFPLGTKRMCMDTGYFETFNAEHVHLVDLNAEPIEEVTARGVRTAEREYPVDMIVLATGFDAMTGALTSVDIRGRDGLPLADKWNEGPRSYLGLAVAGFPNLFTITGPGSPSVLSNMVVSIEQHVEWVTDAILAVRERGATTIEAEVAAEQGWVEHVAELANTTLYPRANSWYMGANVPGKPRVFMAYLGGVGPYRQVCQDVADKDYEGFALT